MDIKNNKPSRDTTFYLNSFLNRLKPINPLDGLTIELLKRSCHELRKYFWHHSFDSKFLSAVVFKQHERDQNEISRNCENREFGITRIRRMFQFSAKERRFPFVHPCRFCVYKHVVENNDKWLYSSGTDALLNCFGRRFCCEYETFEGYLLDKNEKLFYLRRADSNVTIAPDHFAKGLSAPTSSEYVQRKTVPCPHYRKEQDEQSNIWTTSSYYGKIKMARSTKETLFKQYKYDRVDPIPDNEVFEYNRNSVLIEGPKKRPCVGMMLKFKRVNGTHSSDLIEYLQRVCADHPSAEQVEDHLRTYPYYRVQKNVCTYGRHAWTFPNKAVSCTWDGKVKSLQLMQADVKDVIAFLKKVQGWKYDRNHMFFARWPCVPGMSRACLRVYAKQITLQKPRPTIYPLELSTKTISDFYRFNCQSRVNALVETVESKLRLPFKIHKYRNNPLGSAFAEYRCDTTDKIIMDYLCDSNAIVSGVSDMLKIARKMDLEIPANIAVYFSGTSFVAAKVNKYSLTECVREPWEECLSTKEFDKNSYYMSTRLGSLEWRIAFENLRRKLIPIIPVIHNLFGGAVLLINESCSLVSKNMGGYVLDLNSPMSFDCETIVQHQYLFGHVDYSYLARTVIEMNWSHKLQAYKGNFHRIFPLESFDSRRALSALEHLRETSRPSDDAEVRCLHEQKQFNPNMAIRRIFEETEKPKTEFGIIKHKIGKKKKRKFTAKIAISMFDKECRTQLIDEPSYWSTKLHRKIDNTLKIN